MLVGGVIAAKGAIALLAIGFKALGITIGGIMATLLPAILIVAVLGAVVAGFVVAFRRNVGGIADIARRMWERITLFFRGLQQLFEQGGFSGAVREELNRAENQGLKRFRDLDRWIRVRIRAFRFKKKRKTDNRRLPIRRLERWGLLSLAQCRPTLRRCICPESGRGSLK